MNSPNQELPNKDEVTYEPEGDSYIEQLLKALLLAYQDAYNKHNPKYEIKYILTLTNHKVHMKDGNKDVAYLRLDRGIKEKNVVVEKEASEVPTPDWAMQLVHNEMYVFKSMNERLNPKAPWKEDLFLATLSRLTGAGLEYAELLQRMKNTNLKELKDQEEKGLDLVITNQMPKPLTPDEVQYAKDIKAIREAEGIK